MKKLFVLVACLIASVTVANAQWSVGGRIGTGFQAVGQYHFGNPFYLEGRFGMSFVDNAITDDGTWYIHSGKNHDGSDITADFTMLAAWRCCEFGQSGFGAGVFDAGVGVRAGGFEDYAYVGACGLARIGYDFKQAHVTLTYDWTPTFGPDIVYWNHGKDNSARFHTYGLLNMGLTCTYNF